MSILSKGWCIYHFDEQSHCLFGERSKRRYSLGDEVKIIVARVSLDERKMDFSLVQSRSGNDDVDKNPKATSPYGKKPKKSKYRSKSKKVSGNTKQSNVKTKKRRKKKKR